MFIFVIIIIIFAFACSPFFRYILSHLYRHIIPCIIDTFYFFKLKKYNEYNVGRIVCYTGTFGKGKTLNAVDYVCQSYRKYNGKRVGTLTDGNISYYTQYIHVVSNVDLNIPFEKFEDMAQLYDMQQRPSNVKTIYLIDEASVVLSSRAYRENFANSNALNSLLTCRHHGGVLVLTSQRFSMIDNILRQNTTWVIQCNYYKGLRLCRLDYYDAWEMENCSNPRLLKSYKRIYKFVSNAMFGQYDTLAMVTDITKKATDGYYTTDSELANSITYTNDISVITRENKRLHKLRNSK